jgi:hypothetical protein
MEVTQNMAKKNYTPPSKTRYMYAISVTQPDGKPYLFLQEKDSSLLLTTEPVKAKLFDSVDEAREFYTNFVLPNVLIGNNPLQILNSISLFEMSIEFGFDHELKRKGG